jgi:predicted membrane channel-forming protein YqfA (hemolysin III family)
MNTTIFILLVAAGFAVFFIGAVLYVWFGFKKEADKMLENMKKVIEKLEWGEENGKQ